MAPIPHSQASMSCRHSYITCSAKLLPSCRNKPEQSESTPSPSCPSRFLWYIIQRLTCLICLLAIFCHQDFGFKHKPWEQLFLPPPFQVMNRLRINAHLEETEENHEQCLGFQDHATFSKINFQASFLWKTVAVTHGINLSRVIL